MQGTRTRGGCGSWWVDGEGGAAMVEQEGKDVWGGVPNQSRGRIGGKEGHWVVQR